MRALLLCLILTACGPRTWRTRDTILEASAVAVTVIDWRQTGYVTRDCHENNPIIGECGDRVNKDVYFASVLLIQGAVAALIGQDWRSVFLGAWIGAEGTTVWDNKLEGVPLW